MNTVDEDPAVPPLRTLTRCFEGAVPAVIATSAASGVPNVTYLSRIRRVDDERVALSNQFFSKTSRNLAENPHASVLVIDPDDYSQFRLTLAYERTERRGATFERLRDDVDAIAAMSGMQSVFKLRSADIYRVVAVDRLLSAADRTEGTLDTAAPHRGPAGAETAPLAELTDRISRCGDLDTLADTLLAGLDELLGFSSAALLLAEEDRSSLFTLASRGFPAEGVGSEVDVGDGIIGLAASGGTAVRFGNVRQMAKYSRAVRRGFEGEGSLPSDVAVPVPELPDVQSRMAVPLMTAGEPVGVLAVESTRSAAFDDDDEARLVVVAAVLAPTLRALAAAGSPAGEAVAVDATPALGAAPGATPTCIRSFAVDGSTFLDDDYLIRGVAGRVLVSLLRQHLDSGRVDFSNREIRLDPSLELPAFRDNLESRLILLKRRLAERAAPIQIERTGRGRFRLVVTAPVELEVVPTTDEG